MSKRRQYFKKWKHHTIQFETSPDDVLTWTIVRTETHVRAPTASRCKAITAPATATSYFLATSKLAGTTPSTITKSSRATTTLELDLTSSDNIGNAHDFPTGPRF